MANAICFSLITIIILNRGKELQNLFFAFSSFSFALFAWFYTIFYLEVVEESINILIRLIGGEFLIFAPLGVMMTGLVVNHGSFVTRNRYLWFGIAIYLLVANFFFSIYGLSPDDPDLKVFRAVFNAFISLPLLVALVEFRVVLQQTDDPYTRRKLLLLLTGIAIAFFGLLLYSIILLFVFSLRSVGLGIIVIGLLVTMYAFISSQTRN